MSNANIYIKSISQNQKDSFLSDAAEHGHLKIAELLIQHGADVDSLCCQPLRLAAMNGNLKIVELLLKHGAIVHINSDYTLQYQYYYGHDKVIELLKNHIRNLYKG